MTANVIAIDGPAGSGKSSTARAVAQRLGFAHLDSGALYRAVTLAGIEAGVEFTGGDLVRLADGMPVTLRLGPDGYRPWLGDRPVDREVRGVEVTARVSEVAAQPEVRDWVNRCLRGLAAEHPRGIVSDGRDIGTVVFPDAPLKVYLTASPRERAARRAREMGWPDDRIPALTADLEARDGADASRAVAPLRRAADAVDLDTTDLTLADQVAQVVELARKAFSHVDLA